MSIRLTALVEAAALYNELHNELSDDDSPPMPPMEYESPRVRSLRRLLLKAGLTGMSSPSGATRDRQPFETCFAAWEVVGNGLVSGFEARKVKAVIVRGMMTALCGRSIPAATMQVALDVLRREALYDPTLVESAISDAIDSAYGAAAELAQRPVVTAPELHNALVVREHLLFPYPLILGPRTFQRAVQKAVQTYIPPGRFVRVDCGRRRNKPVVLYYPADAVIAQEDLDEALASKTRPITVPPLPTVVEAVVAAYLKATREAE